MLKASGRSLSPSVVIRRETRLAQFETTGHDAIDTSMCVSVWGSCTVLVLQISAKIEDMQTVQLTDKKSVTCLN